MNAPAHRPSRETSTAALQGRLEEVSLFDICQFMMLNRKTGTLTARHGRHSAYFTFDQGQLLNAIDDTLKNGEEIVLAAVQWIEGTFAFEAGPVDPTRKIQSSTENVLLEAARQLDEMSAGDLLEDDGVPVESHVDRFQQTNRRSAELSDAFRDAVSFDNDASLGAEWKTSFLEALSENRAERILIGPDETVHVVHGSGTTPVEVRSFPEVMEWVSSMAPVEPEWDAATGSPVGAWGPGAGENRIWVTRHSGPEGCWFALSSPSTAFPAWDGMGFQDELAQALFQCPDRLLLSAPDDQLLHQSLAAWVARRSSLHPASAWIIEPSPSYDWSRVPGRVRSVAPSHVRETGSLASLCDRTGPALVALRNVHDPAVLAQALAQSGSGLQVLICLPAPSLLEATERLEAIFSGLPNPADGEVRLPGFLGGAWWVQPSPGPSPFPVQTRFLRESGKSRS